MKQDGGAVVIDGVLDLLDVGVIVVDGAGRVVLWNAWMQRASGISAAVATGSDLEVLFPRLGATRLPDAIRDTLEANIPSVLSHTLNRSPLDLKTADGRTMLQTIMVRPLVLEGRPHALLQVTDMTGAADRERLLRSRRDARYRAVVETATDAIVTTDAAAVIQWMNGAAEGMFGPSVGKPIGTILDDAGLWPRAGRLGSPERPVEVTGRRPDGSEVPLEMAVSTWEGDEETRFTTGILRDIAERRRIRAQLEAAVEAKTMLLREINHRVKNSLHLVSSLLLLQAGETRELAVRRFFDDARNRIQAIAQVHERLYQSDRFEAVEVGSYLERLCADVLQASGGADVVDLTVSTERIELPTDMVVPIGMIASELITNAVKHGTGIGKVKVDVTFRRDGESFDLRVCDQGPGLPPGFELGRARGLGMRLVVGFAQQLDAVIDLPETETGAMFRIRGPLRH